MLNKLPKTGSTTARRLLAAALGVDREVFLLWGDEAKFFHSMGLTVTTEPPGAVSASNSVTPQPAFEPRPVLARSDLTGKVKDMRASWADSMRIYFGDALRNGGGNPRALVTASDNAFASKILRKKFFVIGQVREPCDWYDGLH